MKKFHRFLVLALAVVLACSVSLTALADDCYDGIQYLLGSSESTLYIGATAYVYEQGTGEKSVMLIYSQDENKIYLSSETQTTVFESVEPSMGMAVIYYLASGWDTLVSYLAEGNSLVLGYYVSETEGAVYLTTAEEAAAFVNQLNQLMTESAE